MAHAFCASPPGLQIITCPSLLPPTWPSLRLQVGDTVMALQRAVLQPGGREMIVYGTISGAIGEALDVAGLGGRASVPCKHC